MSMSNDQIQAFIKSCAISPDSLHHYMVAIGTGLVMVVALGMVSMLLLFLDPKYGNDGAPWFLLSLLSLGFALCLALYVLGS